MISFFFSMYSVNFVFITRSKMLMIITLFSILCLAKSEAFEDGLNVTVSHMPMLASGMSLVDTPVACQSRVRIRPGFSYSFSSPPGQLGTTTRCNWRFVLPANSEASLQCDRFQIPCSWKHALRMAGSNFCTETTEVEQNINFSIKSQRKRRYSLRILFRIARKASAIGEGLQGCRLFLVDSSTTPTPPTSVSPPTTTTTNQPEPQCGLSFANRIVGGSEATPNNYPWAAFIITSRVIDGENQNSICGATILSNTWLVTAAHCVHNYVGVQVRMGCHKYDRCEAIRPVSRVIIHADYNPQTLESDIAVIRLTNPVTFSTRIQPACLPASDLPDDTEITVMGWGLTSTGANPTISTALKFGIMYSQPSSVCNLIYGSLFNPSTMICGEDEGANANANICSGDSGTSMGTYLNQRFQLDGINSFVHSNGCDFGPNGFVRVRTFVPWIQNYLQQ